jgi:hypothetical protein
METSAPPRLHHAIAVSQNVAADRHIGQINPFGPAVLCHLDKAHVEVGFVQHGHEYTR